MPFSEVIGGEGLSSEVVSFEGVSLKI